MNNYSLRHYRCHTALGEITIVSGVDTMKDDKCAVTGIYFPLHHPAPPRNLLGLATDTPNYVQQRACEQINEYLAGERTSFNLPTCFLHGTAFQQDVWNALADITYGTTTSYAAIAKRIGRPRAVRAVGRAVGANPISLVIPCHRVVGIRGQLTGYAGGLQRKKYLLTLESDNALNLSTDA